MDYYEIGQRIRRLRKQRDLSQEELAERVDISVTHMSHIETGNTKLSLPVFVAISRALEVSTETLLCDQGDRKNATDLANCTESQAAAIREIVDAAVTAIKKYL